MYQILYLSSFWWNWVAPYPHCATILALVIIASFEIIKKSFFTSLKFMMTYVILNLIT